jgi:hypothetical protein
MTLVATGIAPVNQSYGISNFATGYYTGDGTAGTIIVNVGFTPRRVVAHNMTDGLTYEWIDGMTAGYYKLHTWSTGVVTYVNTNAALISTNATVISITEVNFGGAGAGDGTNGTVSINEEYAALGTAQLSFVNGTSGAGLNVSAKVYIWTAES